MSTAQPDHCIIDAYSRGQRLTQSELNLRTFQRRAPPQATSPARPVEVYVRFLNNIALLVNRMNIERVIHTPSGQWSVSDFFSCFPFPSSSHPLPISLSTSLLPSTPHFTIFLSLFLPLSFHFLPIFSPSVSVSFICPYPTHILSCLHVTLSSLYPCTLYYPLFLPPFLSLSLSPSLLPLSPSPFLPPSLPPPSLPFHLFIHLVGYPFPCSHFSIFELHLFLWR